VKCALCGEPARGRATINGVRYCHDENVRPSCYENAMWQKGLTMRPPTGVDNLLNLIDEDAT
jgi:hypothetical protein